MTTPARRPWPWLALLVAFLTLELPAAMSKRVRGYWVTLSETVPRWYPTRTRFLLLAQFLILLIVHLYGMVAISLGEPGHWYWSAQAIAASGALAASSIVYAERWERRSNVSIWGDVKRLLVLKAVRDRLQEAGKMGHLKVAAFALAGAVLTAIMAQITGACPQLIGSLPAIITAGVGGLITYYMRKPLTAAARKATIAGGIAFSFAAVVEQLKAVCGADFVSQLPTLAMAGAWVGFGLWLHTPRESPGLGSVTPPALKG